jgi:hypothetical protein
VTLPPFGKDAGRRCPHRLGNGFGTATRTSPPRSMWGQSQDAPGQPRPSGAQAFVAPVNAAKARRTLCPASARLQTSILGTVAGDLRRSSRQEAGSNHCLVTSSATPSTSGGWRRSRKIEVSSLARSPSAFRARAPKGQPVKANTGWNPGDHATQRPLCPERAHGVGFVWSPFAPLGRGVMRWADPGFRSAPPLGCRRAPRCGEVGRGMHVRGDASPKAQPLTSGVGGLR